MTTESRTAPTEGDVQIADVEVRTWFVWCAAPGCPNCMRISTGEPARFRCAVHVSPFELLAPLTSPLAQLGGVFDYALRFRNVPVALDVLA